MLTTYFKWLNLFPEIRAQILAVFQRYRHVLDAELQQRACEYMAIAEKDGDELLQVVCDEMPPFPERESALLNRLLKKHGDAGDKHTWHAGGKDVNKDKDVDRYKGFGRKKDSTAITSSTAAAPNGTSLIDDSAAADSPKDLMSDLADLDLSATSPPQSATTPLPNGSTTSPTLVRSATPAKPVLAKVPEPVFTHGTEKSLLRLSYSAEGVLYEDAQIQIGLKSEYHGHLGRLALYFGNKISVSFESFTVNVDVNQPDALSVTLPKIPSSTLAGMTQVQQILQVDCKDIFTEAPILRVSYLAGSLQTLTFRLPIYLSKFIEPVKLNQADFFERWKQIGGPPREGQQIYPIKLDSEGQIPVAKHTKILSGMKMGILEGIDPKPTNHVGAAVLHMSSAGKVGCLLRLEPNAEAKVSLRSQLSSAMLMIAQLCRLTIRSTNDAVTKEMLARISQPLVAA